MRLLVTRPEADAPATVRALEERGHSVVLEPLLRIEPVPGVVVADKDYQAVLVTSANAVRALARLPQAGDLKDTLVLAVGESSGRAAALQGFGKVDHAAGDLSALAELVSARCAIDGGPLLYAAGSVVSGDLKRILEARGYAVDRVVLYEAIAAESISAAVADLLREGIIDGILLYSPRSARTWVRAVEHADLAEAAGAMVHVCLSEAVAAALREESGWAGVDTRVASEPNEKSLLKVI